MRLVKRRRQREKRDVLTDGALSWSFDNAHILSVIVVEIGARLRLNGITNSSHGCTASFTNVRLRNSAKVEQETNLSSKHSNYQLKEMNLLQIEPWRRNQRLE